MSVFKKNFYSSIQQYDTPIKNKRFKTYTKRTFNEGPIVNKKIIDVNTSNINTLEIDQFRQGVEITNPNYTRGLVKIYAGTEGHIIVPTCYGINERNIISINPYKEIDYFSPVDYIKAQEPGVNIADVITFPIITSDNDQQENYTFNGIIEPLTIRAAASFFSIEFPFESRSIKGSIMGGNVNVANSTSDQVLTVDYIQNKLTQKNQAYITNRWFLDSSQQTISLLSGSTSTPIPLLGTGYINYMLNSILPFNDAEAYLASMGINVQKHGNGGIDDTIAKTFLQMSSSTGNYIPPNKKSSTTGFVYDNIGIAGTDSIAFGGMTY